jgi:hypothetical protein
MSTEIDPKPSWTALLAVAAQHWMGDYCRTPQKRAVPIRSDRASIYPDTRACVAIVEEPSAGGHSGCGKNFEPYSAGRCRYASQSCGWG